jgi:hypothetical protein
MRKHPSSDAQRHLPQTLLAAPHIFNPPARAAIGVAIKLPYLLHSVIIINSNSCNNGLHCQPLLRTSHRMNAHLHPYLGVNLTVAADSCTPDTDTFTHTDLTFDFSHSQGSYSTMMASFDSPSSSESAIGISPTPSSHGLFSVPNEVLSMIVLECESTDLKNLRLTSKLMQSISTGPFARKYFSRRRFLLTYPSMKALVDITAHPTFAPYLTCITFGTYRLVQSPDDDLDSPISFSDIRLLARRYSAEAMQSSFIRRKEHVSMLVTALENLRKYQNTSTALGIYDDIHDGEFRRRGYALKASYQGCCDFEPDSATALDGVLTAWLRSGYPLQTLKLFLSKDSDSLEGLTLPNRKLELFLPYERSEPTTVPDLHVNIWQEKGSYAKMKISSGLTCLGLSRHYVGDRELRESSLIAFDEAQYGVLWQTIMSGPSQSISLETSDSEYDDLVQLLQDHKDSLRTVKLSQVRMTVYETPKDLTLRFLRFLRDELDLTCLMIDSFCVEDLGGPEPLITLPASEEELVWDGREEVVEGLESDRRGQARVSG